MTIRRITRGLWIGMAAVSLTATAAPTPVRAHGPTLRVAWSGVRPKALTIPTGTTVHFHNANPASGACTIVSEDGALESPTLSRGEGWHHTFSAAGTFALHVREFSSARATIVVVDP